MRKFTKRLIDLIGSCVALILLSPVFLGVSLLVWLTMGGPVFFRQERAGYQGRPFTVLKFRTMRETRDASGRLLPDAERLSEVGRFLRRFSLDELPQFWNVFVGDMSLVGPRPLLVQYLSRYSAEQARRHDTKPGITGWSQVNGRNTLDWAERFRLDVWYVDHWSPGLDLRILWMTFIKAFRGEGISQEGHVTMPEFMGNGN